MLARASRGEVEPLVSADEIQRNAVALVVHQSEHGLCEGISLSGSPRVEIGGGFVKLRDAKAMLVQEAEQTERFRVSALCQGSQVSGCMNVIAAGKGRGPPR